MHSGSCLLVLACLSIVWIMPYRGDRTHASCVIKFKCSCCHFHELSFLTLHTQVEYIDVPKRTLMTVPGYTEPVEFGVLTSFA